MRGLASGEMEFFSKDSCIIKFKMKHEKSKVAELFTNKITINTQHKGNYLIVNDSTLVFGNERYFDTCIFNYQSTKNNKIQFKKLIYGEIKNNDYAICYGLDSIIYSQSAKFAFGSQAFADSVDLIGKFDSIQNKRIRRQKIKEYKRNLKLFNDQLIVTDYKGRYNLDKNRLFLLNTGNQNFTQLKWFKDSIEYKISTIVNLFEEGVTRSSIKRTNYGYLSVSGDKASLNYRNLVTGNKEILESIDTSFLRQEFNVKKHSLLQIELVNTNDSVTITKDPLRVKHRIGGWYNSIFESLNGLNYTGNKLCFIRNKVYVQNTKGTFLEGDYTLTEDSLLIYHNNDTLIDYLQTGKSNNIVISNRNNEPLFYGSYYFKNAEAESHDFLIFFKNNQGVSYSSASYDYKLTRKAINIDNASVLDSNDIKTFTYTVNKSQIDIAYETNEKSTYVFFNNYKGLKSKDKKFVFNP